MPKIHTALFLLCALAWPALSIAENITPINEIRRGMSVNLQGEVTRILDEDEFRLQDATGSIRVYIGWKNRVRVQTGEKVMVRGFIDDDLADYFRPEVYATEIVREDGSVIQLHHD
jgi:uncharacterized protein YdeI (BOF family)